MAIRFAREADAPALTAIYGQYIDTPITFEYELPSEEAFAGRIREISAFYPYLVWEEGGRALGYAYAHRAQERAAYQWNAELSVYLDKSVSGRGIGERLYRALERILALQGIRTLYAGVVPPNRPSERLHEKSGFRRFAVYRNVGYKDGAWRDVVWFEKDIAPGMANPTPPTGIGQLPRASIEEILRIEGQ